MPEQNNQENCEKGLPQFIRNKYFFGKLLTVRDFNLEQSYFINKIRFSHKFLHGYGTVCGLNAKISSVSDEKLEMTLSSGVAIDCCGNEIVVSENVTKEVENWENVDKSSDIYILLKYAECETEPVPNVSNASTCEEECCNSRIEETFSLYATNDKPSEESVFSVISHKDTVDEIVKEIKEKYYDGKLKEECPSCDKEGVLIAVITKIGSSYEIDENKTSELRPLLFTNPMLKDLIVSHASDFGNPHRVTAKQTGAIVSVEGLKNPGGNIDIEGINSVRIGTEELEEEDPKVIIDVTAIETINGIGNTGDKFISNINLVSNDASIEIEEDSENNEIDLKLSQSLQNQILDIQKYLRKLETVFMYIRERALKCTVINFRVIGNELKNEIALEISKIAKDAVDEKVYEKEEEFSKFLKNVIEREQKLAESLEGSVTEKSLKEFMLAIKDLEESVDSGDILKAATSQDEVCFYALQLESSEQPENNCEKTLNCILVSFRNITSKFGSPTAKEITAQTDQTIKEKICNNENKTREFIASLKFETVLEEVQNSATDQSFKEFRDSITQLRRVLEEGTIEAVINSLSNVCDKASKLEKVQLITVPQLTGININDAKKLIAKANLNVGEITTKVDNSKPVGTVLNQNPKAGARVNPNTPVNLVVSKRSIIIERPGFGGTVLGGGTVFGGGTTLITKKLTDVSGIGNTTATKLSKAGIKDANTLAKTKPEKVAKILGVSINKARTLVENAKKTIK